MPGAYAVGRVYDTACLLQEHGIDDEAQRWHGPSYQVQVAFCDWGLDLEVLRIVPVVQPSEALAPMLRAPQMESLTPA